MAPPHRQRSRSEDAEVSRAVAVVALGAATISFAPVLVKLCAQAGVGPSGIGAWRALIGSAVLFLLARLRGAPLIPSRGMATIAALAGTAFAADLFVWHRSIAIVGAGMATILGNTQVFWTSTYGRLAYGEPLAPRFVLATVSAFAGVVLLAGVGSEVAFTSTYLAGVGFGLGTGLAYACYILTVQRATGAGPRYDAGRTTGERALDPLTRSLLVLAWVGLITGALLLASAAITGEPVLPPSLRALGLLAALAGLAHVLGWIVITTGLRNAPASRAGLALLLQPVLATIWGYLWFAETLAAPQIAGAALTIGAIYLGNRR